MLTAAMKEFFLFFNHDIDRYKANCSELSLSRLSCHISEPEAAKKDLVASLRMIFSLLSIIGAISIVISVIRRRQILNPKIHTIFVLAIADLLLAVMWVVGGGVWLSGGINHADHTRVGCFTILLVTVILECVTVNLTCVYALLTYSSIKRKDFSRVYSLFDKDIETQAWKPWKIILAYIISWVLPVILIMVPFSVVAGPYHLVEEANNCSCRCEPYIGNLVPLASSRDNETVNYLFKMKMLVASYTLVMTGNYLVGFTLLVVVYWKTLKLIQKMRKLFTDNSGLQKTYGISETVISQGQSNAKQRVIYFLTVFLITGLFNLCLSFAFVIHESQELRKKNVTPSDKENKMPIYVLAMFICQSVSVPLQGFLNAIVYGWTRSEFVQVIRSNKDNVLNRDDRLYREQMSLGGNDSSLNTSTTETDGESTYARSWARRDLLPRIPENYSPTS